MKKLVVFIILFLFMLFGAIGYFIYDDYKLKLDNTKFILKDTKIEVYEEYKLSSLFENFDGVLDDDYSICEQELGHKKYEFTYKYKNKPRKGYIEIDVVDLTKPIAILKDSYTVYVNSNDDITSKIVTADNYDSDPKKEIIGEYNLNSIGEYNVTYKVTDNSNNILEIPFTLYVKEKPKTTSSSSSYTSFETIKNEHKNDSTKIGIDVSKWQGNINFNKLKNSGVEFMYIRVGTQNGFNADSIVDQYFIQNIKGANENNIDTGIYYYSYATSKEEAHEQALWVINQIKDYDVKLPIAFDWESFSNFNGLKLSLHEFNEIAEEFMKTIKEAGYEASLYGSKNYLINIWKTNYPVWLAHYTTKTDYTGKYYMWQLCNNGKVNGINGYVDIDVLYNY